MLTSHARRLPFNLIAGMDLFGWLQRKKGGIYSRVDLGSIHELKYATLPTSHTLLVTE